MTKKVVGFGEILLRLSPPNYLKLIQTDTLSANYTGAEANSLVSLSRFGYDTELVTKLPKNEVAECAVATLKKYDVGTGRIVYGGDRLGTYYSEKGASQRPSKVIYDRKYSSISMAQRSDFDWDAILDGADALLFTGITAALGEELPAICMDACIAAKKKGVTVFCDLNFRKKLWSEEKAQTVMCALMPYVDVVLGNEEDSEKVLGIKPVRSDVVSGELSREDYKSVAEEICGRFGCRRVAFSLRKSISANDNVWSGMLYENGNAEFSRSYNMHIVDRMGGGDSFGAGIIYATLEGMNTADSIEFATASSCLKHSIELDFNLSTLEDVHQLLSGDGSGRIQR